MTQITDLLTPELRAEVNRQVQADQAKAAFAERENARNSGVRYAGAEPIQFKPRTQAQVLADADKAVAKTQAFRASPRGRFLAAVSRMEREGEYAATSYACRAFFGRELADERQAISVSSIAKTLAALNACDGEAARNARAALCDLLIGEQSEAA